MSEFNITLWRKNARGQPGSGNNPNEIREYQIEHCVGGEYLGTVAAGRGSLGCWAGNVFRFEDQVDAIQFIEFHKKDNDAPPPESDVPPPEPPKDPDKGKSEKQIAKEARKKEWDNKAIKEKPATVAKAEHPEPFRPEPDDLLGMIPGHGLNNGPHMPEIIMVRRRRLKDLTATGWVYVPDYIRTKAAERDKMLNSYKEMLNYLSKNC